ncbi:MAG: two-component regulator propeller domain-containing protein [Melioribacteraceae bacterium]
MIKIFKNIAKICIVLLFTSSIIFSQTLNFHNYSTADGLPQNSVFAIAQDSSGFLWFGTEAGIARFDGVNFKKYDMSDGLVGNTVHALFIDSKNSLWVGTTNGLSILSENKFKNYTVKDGLPDDYVYSITEDNNNEIWIVTRYGGACKFEGNKIISYTKKNGFPSNRLSSVIKDRRGNLWFASTDKGIIKYDGNMFVYFSSKEGLQSNDVLKIFEDKNGLLWIGTTKGLSTFDGRSFINYSSKDGFPSREVNVIQEDIYGDIWFGLYNKGVYRYDGKKVFSHLGIAGNGIRSILMDKRGDIWFGTFAGGVSRLPADWFSIYSKKSGLADDITYAISEDENGSMYFGHYGKGTSILKDDKVIRLTKNNGLVSNKLSSFLFDSRNNKWFGTFNGVTIQNNKNKKFKNILKDKEVLKIYEDKLGDIWFGTSSGVIKYDTLKNEIIAEYGKKQGFDDTWVNDILEDKNGNYWFATDKFGLKKYDGKSFTTVDTSNGLPINNILSITEDEFGNLWFCTDGSGICKYDGNTFTTITEKDGLSSNTCYFIVEDNKKLYIGSTNGITILDNEIYNSEKQLVFSYIGKSEGIHELNQGAYYKDRKGHLWFGTDKGVIEIDPNRKPLAEQPLIFLSEIKVSDGNTEDVYLEFESKELDYNHNNITFKFHSISFSKPEETIYQFKLKGIEDSWSETNEQSVSYRVLQPGNYSFLTRVKNSDGFVGKEKILGSFSIQPPFYKTWWFIAASILVGVFILYSFFYIKTQQVKKRNIALRKMVEERTKELEIEKNKSDELLHNILPSSLVEELKTNGKVKPREFKNISIMFTDFKAFTYTTSVLPAEELVAELNDIFGRFDDIISKYGLEKLKTIGDSYMAACGIPNEVEDHAIKIVYAALDFQKIVKERNKKSAIKWEMRLGIHSGSVVAGVVGTKKFTYDIWGDTVNIASRMESSGEPGKINVSAYTFMLVRDYFDCEYRGKINAKNKGYIDMYFIRGINKLKTHKYQTSSKSNHPLKHIT